MQNANAKCKSTMQNAKAQCKMQNAKAQCKMQNAKSQCKIQNAKAKCKMQNVKCKMQKHNAKCKMQKKEEENILSVTYFSCGKRAYCVQVLQRSAGERGQDTSSSDPHLSLQEASKLPRAPEVLASPPDFPAVTPGAAKGPHLLHLQFRGQASAVIHVQKLERIAPKTTKPKRFSDHEGTHKRLLDMN